MISGLHVIQCPTGRFIFRGMVSAALGVVVDADRSAVLGGRTIDERSATGAVQMIKFPTFASRAAAILHADAFGFEVSGK